MTTESPRITRADRLGGGCTAMIPGRGWGFCRGEQRQCGLNTAKIRWWCNLRFLGSLGSPFRRWRPRKRMQDRRVPTSTPAGIFLLARLVFLVICLSLFILIYLFIDILSARGGLDTIASYHTDVLADDLLFQFFLGLTLHSLW